MEELLVRRPQSGLTRVPFQPRASSKLGGTYFYEAMLGGCSLWGSH